MMKRISIIALLLFAMCGMPPQQKAASIMQEAIKDESAVIRVSAAKGYAQMGDPQGMQVLYEMLRSDDKNGIAAALVALYDLRDRTYSPVIADLTEHEDPLIRSEAYKVMSLAEDKQAHGILVAGTMSRIAKIRRYSFQGLVKFKDEKVLLKGLSDIDPIVRIAAAQALGRIGKKDMDNFIRKEMQIQNIEIWRESITALAEIGDTSIYTFIKDSLISDPDLPVEIRLAAAEALLVFKDPQAVDMLEQGLDSGDPFTRVQVVRILKSRMTDDAVELLKRAVEDEYINVSVVAVEALAAHDAGAHRDIFVKTMDAPNPMLRIAGAAAYLMGE
jgi:HEAT repeat protein